MILRKIQQRLHEEELARKYLKEIERLNREIDRKIKVLAEKAAENGKWRPSWIHELHRLQDYKESIKKEYQDVQWVLDQIDRVKKPEDLPGVIVRTEHSLMNERLKAELMNDLVTIYQEEAVWTRDFLQEYTKGQIKFQFTNELNPRVVKKYLEGLTITNSKDEALTMYDYLKRYSVSSAQAGEDIINTAIALGDSVDNTVRRMAQEFDDIARHRLETTVRTWAVKTHNEANLDTYELAAVPETQFCATLDMAVCARCAAKDGNIYTVVESRGMLPLHPRCRCCWLPLVERKDAFVSREDGYKAWLADDRRSEKDLTTLWLRVNREKGISPKEKKHLLGIIEESLKKKGVFVKTPDRKAIVDVRRGWRKK